MQAIKEKLSDMSAMRKAKAEAKEEEKAEKELAKARVEVAHEVRMAREADAAMDLHVNKAAAKVAEHERKHHHPTTYGQDSNTMMQDSYDPIYGGGAEHGGGALDPSATYGRETGGVDSTASTGSMVGGPPTNNSLL